MIKNKKGFTLIEILAVIAILATIVIIGLVSYNGVEKSMNEKSLSNLESLITQKAINYAFDTSITIFTLQTLIDNGYIDSEEDGNIYNPVNKEIINCQKIELEYVNGKYELNFKVDKDNEAKDCIIEKPLLEGLIEVYNESDVKISPKYDTWFNENLVLKTSEDLTKISSLKWSTPSGFYSTDNTINIKTDSTVNEEYNLVINYKDGTTKTSKIKINIDKESPVILKESMSLKWQNTDKKVEILASDLNGSGVDNYYFSNTKKCENPQKQNYKNLDNGTYYACVSDKLGNKSVIKKFTVSRVDKEKPIINSHLVTLQNNNKLTVNATDNKSGILGYSLIDKNSSCSTEDFNNEVTINKSGELKLCVIDNALNITSKNITIGKYEYVYNNGKANKIIFFEVGVSNFLLEKPTKTNYTFNYWEKGGKEVNSTLGLTINNTLNAVYHINDFNFSVIKYNEDKLNVVSPIHLIFVLDESGSMNGAEEHALEDAVDTLMDSSEFSEETIFSIVAFENGARTIISYTNSKEDVKNYANISPGGGTSFSAGLSYANSVAVDAPNGFDKDNTYVIFLSDGHGSGETYANTLKQNVTKIYSVGIGSGASGSSLKYIASEDDKGNKLYYSTNNLNELASLFLSITEDIAENNELISKKGSYELPDIVVNNELLFTIEYNGKILSFSDINKLNELITIQNGKKYLNFTKLDEKYNTGGHLRDVKITYYYNGGANE